MKLIEEIMLKYKTNDVNVGRKSRTESPLRLQGNHFPSYLPETEKKTQPYRKCVVHKYLSDKTKSRKDTRIYCDECNIVLCAMPCFRIYHNLSDLNQLELFFGQV